MQPTYLYIKEHGNTGLKYFGKTTKDPIKYIGSGIHWKSHIRKHGKNIKTLWYQLFTNEKELVEYALKFSKENNIVESKKWANMKEENGLDGGMEKGFWSEEQKKQNSERIKKVMKSESHRQLLSEKSKQYWNSLTKEEQNKKREQFLEARKLNYKTASKGKHWKLSDETKNKMSAAKKGYKMSDETKKKLSEKAKLRTGRKHSPETKEKMRLSALQRKVKT
jgi:hypothetical protein